MMETFLAKLRERFDVKEGEGQPVSGLATGHGRITRYRSRNH